MNSQSMPESIRVLFDSYRDDVDLGKPEMFPLRTWLSESTQHRQELDAMRRMDDRIKSALHEVPVPAGLKDRILQSVANADATALSEAIRSDVSSTERDVARVQPAACDSGQREGTLISRRRANWLISGAALAAMAAAVMLILNWGTPSARDICNASLTWIEQTEHSPWIIGGGPNAEDFPFVPKQIGWKQIRTDFGTTDCYLTSLDNGARIFRFHFAAPTSVRLPERLPLRPNLRSQSFACAAYRQGDEVIVVAVEGDAEAYRQAIELGLPFPT